MSLSVEEVILAPVLLKTFLPSTALVVVRLVLHVLAVPLMASAVALLAFAERLASTVVQDGKLLYPVLSYWLSC